MDLKEDLGLALDRGELRLDYQPTINLETNAISGCEALLRWTHPQQGAISPAVFVPAAEASGLIEPIGAWVLERACADAGAWPPHIKVAVNLSVVQFKSNRLPAQVAAAVEKSGLAPARLELEITESVLIDDNEHVTQTLQQLHALGVRIALDDFGTGYSSLSYLQRFAFDRIKIDRSFVRTLATQEASSRAIIRAVARLGTNLGMATTAEGIETERQLEVVRAEGCSDGQGYFFSPPISATKFAALLTPTKAAASERTWSNPQNLRKGWGEGHAESEEQRLEVLYRYGILDSPAEESFDRITRMAKWGLGVATATVSLVDRDRQWFKSRQGVEQDEMPRNISFCTHAIRSDQPLAVPDALEDARFRHSPLVVGPQKTRSYLGVPLRTSMGQNIGTLCVTDVVPREFRPDQIGFLQDLANVVMDELELRQLAKLDALTGALSARAFFAEASAAFARNKQSGRSSACITVNIRNLAQINEAHGRAAGDRVLADIADLCRVEMSPYGIIGRIQGDEFAVFDTDMTSTSAESFAALLRKKIRTSLIPYSTLAIGATANVGVATPRDDEISFKRMYARASKRANVRRCKSPVVQKTAA